MRALALLLPALCVAAGARAQNAGTAGRDAPAVRAVRAAGPLRLDGVPDEAAWAAADSLTDFHQRDPDEGAPPSERTVVRFLATDDALWVAFWNYEAEPGAIRHTQLRRDGDMDYDDYVGVVLDAQRDRRAAVGFATNANGVLYDGEVHDNDIYDNWNGVWDTRARVTPFGWTAEMRLPWQNFRYPDGARALGLNVVRFIRHRNEELLWRAWRRQEGLFFLEQEGTLVVEGPLPRRTAVEARPYLSMHADADTRALDSAGAWTVAAPGGSAAKAGFDAKVAVAPTLSLDLTANTDFAQVEADRQVVNLSRFPVFFPEQRQFFLESAAIFNLGQTERTQLFHSRRIGLDSAGNVVAIRGGARLTGRVGRDRIGLLAVRTGSGDVTTENAVDLVARVQHDVLSRGYVGAMATYQGGPGFAEDRLGGGLDAKLPLLVHGNNLVPEAFVAVTRNAAGRPFASAWRIFLDYPNDRVDAFFAANRIESGFDPALGFVRQSGVIRTTGAFSWRPRPHRWGVRRLDFKAMEFDISQNLDGSLNNASYEVRPLAAEFESGAGFEFNVTHYDDVPTDSFDLFPGVDLGPGRYHWNRADLQVESSPARPLVVQLEASAGGFYAGRAAELGYDVSLRVAPHLIAAVDGGWQRVRFGGRAFTAQVHRLRLDYATTARLGSTVFVQWDNESERLAVNARLHWIPRAGSDVYVVWTTTWPTALAAGGIPWRRPERGALVGKFVYYFRL